MSNSKGTTPESSTDDDRYAVAVVGGGPAGLTTALYAARLGHETVVFDRGGGRAAMMQDTHNVIGTPESVSGPTSSLRPSTSSGRTAPTTDGSS